MNIEATKGFLKQLKKLNKSNLNVEVKRVIDEIVAAKSLNELKNLKKLTDFTSYYRVRIGNYRIGIFYDGEIVWLAAIADRKDIYKLFP